MPDLHQPTVRCVWQVVAGMIPEQIDPALTRQFALTSLEWDGPNGFSVFMERAAEAQAYVRRLELQCAAGRTCNWTRTEFIWW